MKFRVTADAMFEADDIQDALFKLGCYLSDLGNSMNDDDQPAPDTIFTTGQIEVKPER